MATEQHEETPLVVTRGTEAPVPQKHGRVALFVSIGTGALVVAGITTAATRSGPGLSSKLDVDLAKALSSPLALSSPVGGVGQIDNWKTCSLETNSASLYKYTIASTYASDDADWAAALFGCTREHLDYSCEPYDNVGKTTCSTMELHFIYNENTEEGWKDIKTWDDYQSELHNHSFDNDMMNQFMDYSLTFYTTDLSNVTLSLKESGAKFLGRKMTVEADDDFTELYSLMVSSPGGKAFEIISYEVHESLQWHFKDWSNYKECSGAHESTVYSKTEMDTYYSYKNGGFYAGGLMPIRTNVAVSNLDTVMDWWGFNMPGVVAQNSEFYNATTQYLDDDDETYCRYTSLDLKFYEQSMLTEIRFIENPNAYYGDYSVSDFVTYMEEVNSKYSGENTGWSAWFDRHSGIDVFGCSLDSYMNTFNKSSTSFHPHGRNTTNSVDQATNHMWTPGSEGWGLEIQGSFDYSYADCYSSFDWCTATSDPTSLSGWKCKDGYTYDEDLMKGVPVKETA